MEQPDTFKEGIFTAAADNNNGFTKQKTIIKNRTVKLGNTRVIEPNKIEKNDHNQKVTPVLQEGEVIGITVECGCGEVVKVYFEYDD